MQSAQFGNKPLARTAGEGGSPDRASRVRVSKPARLPAPSPQPSPPMGERELAAAPAKRICVGIITGAHGIQGAVRVKSFTADPKDVARYGPLEDETGERHLSLRVVGSAKGVVIARLAGVADRDRAEGLRGLRLYLPRAALPPAAEEEYYHADLIGLAAALVDGTTLGHVRAIHDFGAGDTLEIDRPEGPPAMVPFTRTVVPIVDLAAGRLVLDPPPGLIDPAPKPSHPIPQKNSPPMGERGKRRNAG
jgi:16S rRNA processing protein RimM